MATVTVSTSQNINALTYVAGDLLDITSGAVLTIDLEDAGDLAKLATNPGTIQCITVGTLSVVNTSTTTPQVITLSANTKDYRFEKNGQMTVRGAAIELGTGTGSSGQAFDLSVSPYDVIPYPSYVEVETGVGTGVYLPWFVVPVAGKTVNWAVTEFCAGGYVAGNVFFWNATTRSLYVGDDTNGNTLTSDVKVRIPNIYFHSATNDATPNLRSLLDLNPTGTFDGEWFAFSDYFYITTTTFKSVRWINGGIAGTLALTSSNGTLEVDGMAICPDTEQTTTVQQLSIQSILGASSVKRITSLTGGLVTSNNKNILSKLYALTTMEDVTCSRRAGLSGVADESLAITSLPSGITIKNLSAIGGRFEITNLSNIIFDNLKLANDLGTAQITTNATYAISITNCLNINFVGLSNAGVSQCRFDVLNPDDQSANIQVYNANFDGGNNTVGMVTGNANVVKIVNSLITNMRSGSFVVNSPSTFLLSGVEILNCRTVPNGTLSTEANQGGIYDLLPCSPANFTTTFTGATDFAFSNLIDTGLTPTTGSIVCGPFGTNDCITLTGSANFDQAGGIELPGSGDIVEVESCFVLHGVTSFQNVAPVFTYTEASTLTTDTSTAPTNLSFEFRIKNPTGTYGAYAAYNATNLAAAVAALTGYDSDEGFKIQMKITATGTDSTLVLNQTYFTTNVDNTYNAPDASFTLAGPNPTDITTLYRYSDDAVLTTFTGDGEHFFYGAANNYLVQVYFIRRDSLGFEVMRTRSSPHTLVLGDNGTETLFAGAEVQLAQSPTVIQNNELLNSILLLSQRVDALIENSSGDRFTAKALETAPATDVSALALEATAQTILDDTSELQTNQGNWTTATGFATPTNVSDAQTAIQADIATKPTLAQMDNLGVNIQQVNGTNTTSIADFKLTASEVWAAPITVAAGTQGLYNAIAGGILVDTTVTGTPTTTEVQLTAGSTIDDFYNDQLIQLLSGTGVGQIRVITDYVGATKTITVDEVFITTPIATDRVIIKSDHVHPISQIQAGLATSTNVTDAQTAIIAQVDANETKIDLIETKAQADARQALLIAEHDATQATLANKLDTSAYTAPDNAGITAIQERTDNLPDTPASKADTITASQL